MDMLRHTKLMRLLAGAIIALLLRFAGGDEAKAQIINDWSVGEKDVVTNVGHGALTGDEYAATGIIEDWKEIFNEYEREAEKADQEVEREIRVNEMTGFRTNRITDRSGKAYDVPVIPGPDGMDMFMLTREGISIYMAMDAPVYLQEVDDDVIKWIRFYVHTKRDYTRKLFRRYKDWEPRIKACFQAESVPAELAELCLIESGCTYAARSSAGAVGMWQIMPDTGRSYGMTINWAQDDRLDPAKSTVAAARILRKNHERTGEWTLAAAAYNCGPGRIAREGEWRDIKHRLPKETQQYIPGLLAIHYVWTYRERLGLEG